MGFVILGLQIIVGIAYLACFVMVIMKMFEHNDKNIAIASLVLTLCCIGPLVAFIFGWINVAKYNIKNIMLAWTAIWVVGVVLGIVGQVMVGSAVSSNLTPPPTMRR